MSAMEIEDTSRILGELLSMYGELVVFLKSEFPKTDLKLLLELMSHEFLHPDHTPSLQIEVLYKNDADLRAKSESLWEKTKIMPSLDEADKRLVFEPRLRLKDIRELTKDKEIRSLAGDVLCCSDSLINRRKRL
jgi:hypothetical protein